jgi:hypothetical protein
MNFLEDCVDLRAALWPTMPDSRFTALVRRQLRGEAVSWVHGKRLTDFRSLSERLISRVYNPLLETARRTAFWRRSQAPGETINAFADWFEGEARRQAVDPDNPPYLEQFVARLLPSYTQHLDQLWQLRVPIPQTLDGLRELLEAWETSERDHFAVPGPRLAPALRRAQLRVDLAAAGQQTGGADTQATPHCTFCGGDHLVDNCPDDRAHRRAKDMSKYCEFHALYGHTTEECRSAQRAQRRDERRVANDRRERAQVRGPAGPAGTPEGPPGPITCFHCGKPGHIRLQCQEWMALSPENAREGAEYQARRDRRQRGGAAGGQPTPGAGRAANPAAPAAAPRPAEQAGAATLGPQAPPRLN